MSSESSQSSVPPSTPSGATAGYGGAEHFLSAFDDYGNFYSQPRPHSPSPSASSHSSMAGSNQGGPGPYAAHFHAQAAQAAMQHQAAQTAMQSQMMQAQMHGIRPDLASPTMMPTSMMPTSMMPTSMMPTSSPGLRPGRGMSMAPPPHPSNPSPFRDIENSSPTFVPTGGSSNKRRAVANPTDKTIAKNYLNQAEVTAHMDSVVKKWVSASVTALMDDLTVSIHNRVDLAVEKYSVVVQSFRAQVVRVDGSGDLHRSDDGNYYLRLNHASLDKYLSNLDSTKQNLEKELANMTRQLAAMKVRMETMVMVSAPVGSTAVASASKGASIIDSLDLKEHKWTVVQAAFRILVHQLAGISVQDKRTKIYDFIFPSSPDQIPYHPIAYVPTEGEIPAPESSAAEGGCRYRKLRLRLDLSYTEYPNDELLKPILTVLVRDFKKYGLPAGITAEVLMHKVLSRSWTHWRTRYNQLNAPGTTPEEVRKGWLLATKKARRRKRPGLKGSRRCAALRKRLRKVPGSSTFDVWQKITFHEDMQSEDETEDDWDDEEDDDEDGAESSRTKTLIRKHPDFRSNELTEFLHSLDDNAPPKMRFVESTDRVHRVPPPGTQRWMVNAEYLMDYPAVSDSLLPNGGPFNGDHSVSVSAEMYGSAPVSVVSSRSVASGTSNANPGSALARLFGSDASSSATTLDHRGGGGLDAGLAVDMGVDEESGMMSLGDILG
ncbi:hypothetical protein CF319_g1612 [Tilletia indica]|nr:hypothetical protein CF319_g1612 [Tilletia indica]